MYHPTTRVLTVLELLQSHQRLSGPEIAARLEVNVRTARRYITMLQDLGIPIEAERGRHGAYRLRPSFKLPPLMFTTDEALAVTLGLLAAHRLGLTMAAPAVEGALAKIERVLPDELRERVQAVQSALVFDLVRNQAPLPGAVMLTLSSAVQERRRTRIAYRSERGEETERGFDPYGLVYRQGRWYAVGHCHLRDDLRVFRLDRVSTVVCTDESFIRPEAFDCAAYVVRSIALMPNTWPVQVLFLRPAEVVEQRVSPVMGTLEEQENGVLMRGYADNLSWFARELVALGMPLRIIEPPQLRDEMRRLGEEILAMTSDIEI
jgi:predicted DNA-binding transcriptional regulator YafY